MYICCTCINDVLGAWKADMIIGPEVSSQVDHQPWLQWLSNSPWTMRDNISIASINHPYFAGLYMYIPPIHGKIGAGIPLLD